MSDSNRAIVLHNLKQCVLNRNACERIRNYLVTNEYNLVQSIKKADLVIYYGCGVTEGTETESHMIVNYLLRERSPECKLIICGCFPVINKITNKHLGDSQDVKLAWQKEDVIILDSDTQLNELDTIVNAKVNYKDIPYPTGVSAIDEFANFSIGLKVINQESGGLKQNLRNQIELQSDLINKDVFYPIVNEFMVNYGFQQIIISEGCKNKCTYCAVKFAKRHIKSLKIDEILERIQNLYDEGSRKFSILSDDLGSWGYDFNSSWDQLLIAISELPFFNEITLALSNVKADDLLDKKEVLEHVLSSGVIKYIEVMAQHVNHHVLESMRRGVYDSNEFADLINYYGERGIHFDTCFIVGFPGETQTQFEELIEFVKLIHTPHFTMYAIPFSDRPGTLASKMDGKVDDEEMEKRINSIRKAYSTSFDERIEKLPHGYSETIKKLNQKIEEFGDAYDNGLSKEENNYLSYKL